jgi:hypothetical protein
MQANGRVNAVQKGFNADLAQELDIARYCGSVSSAAS